MPQVHCSLQLCNGPLIECMGLSNAVVHLQEIEAKGPVFDGSKYNLSGKLLYSEP